MMLTTNKLHDNHGGRSAVMKPADEVDPKGARLAAAVRESLRAASYVPEDDVDVEVRDHAVYLSGTVNWDHQRIAAERAVKHVDGVHVLWNGIRVTPRVSASATRGKIMSTLHQEGFGTGNRIDVDVDDETVTLAGVVGSYTERQIAEGAALSMPPVRTVRNRLRIVKT